MSKKDHKRADVKTAPAPGGGLRAEVENLIRKERYKDAVKQAKMCFREQGTADHHRLLERAYFLRARQLHQSGMPSSAAEVAQHLLEFGVTDPDLPAELAPLLVAVGLSEPALALKDRLGSPEAQARLMLAAADQAVLHPEQATAALPELRRGGRLVRDALETLEAGDEAAALERLRDIARTSPFADWRYFVRGLAAYWRGETEQVAANWDRLDAGRAAARMARALRGARPGEADGPTPPAGGPSLAALETTVFGEPILARLEQLRDLVAQDRWPQATRLLAALRITLRRYDPRLAERLTRLLIPRLVHTVTEHSYHEARELVGSFTRAAEPLPLDPRWNRLWALIWEGPQGSSQEAEEYWRDYLADLAALPNLAPEEKQRTQAMVCKHLGMQYADEAHADPDGFPFGPAPSAGEIKKAKKNAVHYFEESLRHDPRYLPAHKALLKVYQDWDQPAAAEAAAQRLLKAFPDDFETLLFLVHHYFHREEPERALPHVLRARALKPLDESIKQEEWSVRVAHARHLALEKRWDEARAEFAQVEALGLPESSQFNFLARKAVLELKAGQNDRAEEFIREAQAQFTDPTPLWLALLIEAIRYKLPKADQVRFDHLFYTGLAKKGRSDTSGALAALLGSFLNSEIDYPGRSEHVKAVAGYLKRTSRIHYRRDDLLVVCAFLERIPQEAALLEKLAKRGAKNFPESPAFVVMEAGLELQKSPYPSKLPHLRQRLEKALKLAQASNDPLDARYVPEIKKLLSVMGDLTSSPFGMPFPGFGDGGRAGCRSRANCSRCSRAWISVMMNMMMTTLMMMTTAIYPFSASPLTRTRDRARRNVRVVPRRKSDGETA